MKPVQADYLPTTFSAHPVGTPRSKILCGTFPEKLLPMAGMPTNILDSGGLRLARCDFDGVFNAEAEENAKRFMDCWNAMSGIADPAAFMQAVREMVDGPVMGEQFFVNRAKLAALLTPTDANKETMT